MALSLSKALRNSVLAYGSLKIGLQGGCLDIYSGAVPATADDPQTGTKLVRITEASGAWTPEVVSAGLMTLTSGTVGQITQVTVNGVSLLSAPVVFNTSLEQTATDLAAAINEGLTTPDYVALSFGAVVAIVAFPGTGTGPNGLVVAGTLVSLTANYTNFAGGVASINGLKFSVPAAGILAKLSTQVWSGIALASGTATYWRILTEADLGTSDPQERYRRMQGDVGTILVMAPTTVVAGNPVTVTAFSITAPAS